MAKTEAPLNVTVVPAGMWGSALGLKAYENGHNVTLYFRDDQKFENFRNEREHHKLKGIRFPDSIKTTANLEEAVHRSDIVIMAPQARFMNTIISDVSKHLSSETIIVSVSKGLDPKTRRLMTDIIAGQGIESERIAVLAGPNFAYEVAAGQFAGTDIAIHSMKDRQLEKILTRIFCGRNFLPFFHDDRISLQVGTAAKNLIAIAAGLGKGYGLGENAQAFIPASGLADAEKLAMEMGGKSFSRSVIADLFVSCSMTSRNFAAGVDLANNVPVQELLSGEKTIEGLHSAPILYDLAQEYGISAPVFHGITRIVKGEDPKRVLLQGVINTRKLIRGF